MGKAEEKRQIRGKPRMFDFLKNGIWGPVIGLLGIIVAIIIYIKSRVRAKPKCYLDYLRLIGKKDQALPEEIKIVFNEIAVPRVTLTRAYFWNDGQETIYGHQIVEDDSLRFEFEPSSKILKVHVAACTREANKVYAELSQDTINVTKFSFDYLDPGDGARIEILHTSEEKLPELKGSLRGIPKGIKLSRYGENTLLTKFFNCFSKSKIIEHFTIFMGAVISSGFLFLAFVPTGLFQKIHLILNTVPTTQISILTYRLMYLIVSGFFFVALIFLWNRKRKIYPSQLNAKK